MQILKKSHCYPKNPIVSNHVHLKNSFLQNEKLSLLSFILIWPNEKCVFRLHEIKKKIPKYFVLLSRNNPLMLKGLKSIDLKIIQMYRFRLNRMTKLVGLQLFWSGTPTFSSGTPTFC